MRYSSLPTHERISVRNKFNVWGNKINSFVRPFQDDYRNVILRAVDLAHGKRVSHIESYEERSLAQYQLPPAVLGFGDDSLQVYVLNAGLFMPSHGRGDVAVLQLKREPYSQVVLYGESMKQWLDRGVADFVIPANDIGKELDDVMSAWANFSTNYIDNHDPYSSSEKLSNMMSLYDPVHFIETYLYPISHGFDRPEDYGDKIKDILLKSSLPLENAKTDLPSPFMPIRVFE